MPDKSQTININYKFNTAEIEKAQAALTRANAASNKLQESASKGGSAIQKEFNKSSKTILDMQNALTRLKSTIEVTSNPQKLAQLSGEYKNMKKALDEATKSALGLGKATAGSSKGVQGLVTGFNQLSKFAGAALIAGLAKEAVDLTLSMATLQGQLEGVERGFNRAFPNSVKLLGDLREATHGTINDFDLMKRTLQATNLGVGVEHLGTLFEFAAARAQQTGESVDYLVDSIVRGIGRKSPLVLDNLGISVTALKEKFDGASIASKTVGEATEGVAEIAREQLEKMGGYVGTAETKVKALGVAMDALRLAVAKKLQTGGLIDFTTDVINALAAAVKGTEVLNEETVKLEASNRVAAITESKRFAALKEDKLAQIKLLVEEIGKVNTLRQARLKDIQAQEDIIKKTRGSGLSPGDAFARNEGARDRIEQLEKAIRIYDEMNPILANTLKLKRDELILEQEHVDSLDDLRNKLKDLEDAYGNIAATDTPAFRAKAKEIKALRKEIEAIEALLKDPKELKIKIKPFQDDALEKIQKYFDSGGGLAGKKFNASTGAEVDLEAINAKEIIDTDRFEVPEEVIEYYKKVGDELVPYTEKEAERLSKAFWARLRISMKGEGGEEGGLGEEFNAALGELVFGSLDILSDQLMSLADVEANSYDARIRKAKDFYDANIMMAGDNERAKDILRIMEDRKIAELRRKQFVAEQKAAKQKAIINAAVSLVKIWVDPGYPAAIPLSVLIAGLAASQIATIDRQQPRFAKGVIDLKGKGTGTSDSIPAWLSKGESVMTAWETKNAGGVLKDVRAKKLDDKVLRDLKQGRAAVPAQQFNDERIIKAIKDNKPPDFAEQGGVLYKVTQKNEEYRNKVRAKSIRI